MQALIMAAQLILGLSILVTLHELGHFLAARAFGIKVEKFYLFFDAWGVKLFSFKRGETEYGIGWLPLGGYVKIAGMIDESLDTAQMATEPQSWEFRAKPAWQRLIVMIAGVTMNAILGVAIYTFTLLQFKEEYLPIDNVNQGKGIYAYSLGRDIGLQNGDRITAVNGKEVERFEDLLSTRVLFGARLSVLRNEQTLEVEVPDNFYRKAATAGRWSFIGYGPLHYTVGKVTEGKPAAQAGLRAGDIITGIEGRDLLSSDDLPTTVSSLKGKDVSLSLERDGNPLEMKVRVSEEGSIGIAYDAQPVNREQYTMQPYTFASALAFGSSDAMEALVSNVKGLRKIFTGEEKASDSVQGPIGIATIYGGVWDWGRFWAITGLLSMVLAFMNMLPIPALDGGHVIFLLIESVIGVKFSDKVMERAQVVGMVILLSLMVFAVGNDIWKHVLN
ncbi:MAG: RIP metalloprotease RseP [Sphingobacteriales bacterium]|jgi:regulator of sigma E protease|nr:RIP metalloprotease RseP [Sphingobacteriales bacterium]